MWLAIGVTAALLAGDRVLKALSRKGKLHYEGKVVRLTKGADGAPVEAPFAAEE